MRSWFTPSFWHVARLTLAAATVAFVLGVVDVGVTQLLRRPLRVEVLWPKGTPQGILVFLHGFSREPWHDERDGINAVSSFAARRGYITVVPLGERRCGPRGLVRCWSLHDLDADLDAIDDAVRGIDGGGAPLERRIVGFDSGGFFLGAALKQELLDDYARVGIIGAGRVVDDGAAGAAVPSAWREPRGAGRVEDVAGRQLSADRARRFLHWFWGASPSLATTKTTPPAPTPTTAACP